MLPYSNSCLGQLGFDPSVQGWWYHSLCYGHHSLTLPKRETYGIYRIFAFGAASIGLVQSKRVMSLVVLSEASFLKSPSVLANICFPLKLCSYLEKLDVYCEMIYGSLWQFSYCLWPTYIFCFFFDYLFPASAWYNWKKKANIEVYTLQLSDSIFLLLNIYKIDVF